MAQAGCQSLREPLLPPQVYRWVRRGLWLVQGQTWASSLGAGQDWNPGILGLFWTPLRTFLRKTVKTKQITSRPPSTPSLLGGWHLNPLIWPSFCLKIIKVTVLFY